MTDTISRSHSTTVAPELQSQNIKFEFSMVDQPIPLENEWVFWFDRYLGPGLSVEQYEASLKPLGSFYTVQDFWKYYNNIPSVEQLGPRTSYHVMKKGIRPLWEDEHNIFGGNLSFKIPKNDTPEVWLRFLLALIGEQPSLVLKEGDEICGISVSVRKTESLISIWNKRAELIDIEKLESLIRLLISNVDFPKGSYRVHRNEDDFKTAYVPKANQTPTK